MPWNYDERLVPVLPKLTRLAAFALEKHDVALSKTVRGYQNDLDLIAALHARHPLDQEVLIERYIDELDHAIGDRARLDANFVQLIDRLFGSPDGRRARAAARTG